MMVATTAWIIFSLGVLHCVLGVVMFKKPIGEAVNEGLIGKFQGKESRRLAFWFVILDRW
jgi:hypothetical protein